MNVTRRWRKSSHSAMNGNCVEARSDGERVLVRDSKNKRGPVLSFTPEEWAAFLERVKRDN